MHRRNKPGDVGLCAASTLHQPIPCLSDRPPGQHATQASSTCAWQTPKPNDHRVHRGLAARKGHALFQKPPASRDPPIVGQPDDKLNCNTTHLPPPTLSKPATRPRCTKPLVGLFWETNTMQHFSFRDPSSKAAPDLPGYAKKLQQIIQKAFTRSLAWSAGKTMSTLFPASMPKPTMIGTNTPKNEPTSAAK